MKKSNKVFNGAIFTVAMRWSDRFIGLISTVVLARLLMPEDFGIVAMAAIAIGFIDVLLNLGVTQALIHNSNAEREDYDTAWTIRLIQAGCTVTIIFFAAPAVADYFSNANIVNVLRVMSIGVILGGLENIGIVNFQKEMRFDRDFKYFFSKRVIAFLVTISLAFSLHSYWAMVLGALSGRMAGVALSYAMHSFRPRFSMARAREILSFSQWILFKNIGVYFDTTMDRILVGRRLSADVLGGYTIAGEISSLPTTELLAPLGRVLFPALVDTRDDPAAFANRFVLAVGVQALVAFPACLGLVFIATDLIFITLGEKWLFITPVIQIMAISNMIGALVHSCGYALLALGKIRIQAFIIWMQAIMFLIIATLFGANAEATDFAVIRLSVIAMGSTILIGAILVQIHVLTVRAFITPLIRPILATVVMSLLLNILSPVLEGIDPTFRLLCVVTAGAGSYVTSICGLWLLQGRPEGAERYLINNVSYMRNWRS